ncbi:PorV/PorQ family protein [candidate division KSB1 bacterium]|nr:PorV/PorQ family protein [candidate division KSB1 bacterium]
MVFLKINKFCRLFFASLILMLTQFLFAQDNFDRAYKTDVTRRGTAAGTMLEIGIGARAEALGGAFVAIADDPSALHWNPAGIANIPALSVQLTHHNWLVDTQFNAVDLVIPVNRYSFALGVHLAMLDYGESPVRTIARPEGTGETYAAKDLVAGLYGALSITDRISTGIGIKYFYERIWHTEGSNIAFDLSIFYKTRLEGLTLGGAICNFGTEFSLNGRDLTRIMDADGRRDVYFNNDQVVVSYKTEKFPLPLIFRFGMAYRLNFDTRNSLIFSGDLIHPSHNVESMNLGLELKTMNIFFLRAGYQSLFEKDAISGLTLGGGLHYRILGHASFTIDYAWSDWTLFDSVNRFTIGIVAF